MPGPGAYEARSDFKSAEKIRKDPSRGTSSSFRSATPRLLGAEGQVLDTHMYPGRKYNDAPGVGEYNPKDPGAIAVVSAAVKRRAEKLGRLVRGPPKKEERCVSTVTPVARKP